MHNLFCFMKITMNFTHKKMLIYMAADIAFRSNKCFVISRVGNEEPLILF